ncbi:GTP cyclohydrolase I FolE [Paenibacillus aceti]|uniref:GTP cyclohydrolase 1 n=2 Tax=Paenibacillus TaxID=44249 RepID=A0ABQ1W7J1_9BACL|nr:MULTISPECIES: GTP cyclohydrolase I FolE [Paenibacillus]GGG18125.1 GTP cyclohydrolase 1 [Paenibacillus aceti]
MLDVKQNNIIVQNKSEIEKCIRHLLSLLGEDPQREGLIETPARVARAYAELLKGYSMDPWEELGTKFPSESQSELVIVKDIYYYSLCEHHMLPFFGKAHIGYIPQENIIGLSKLGRLLDVFARRFQVQERLTNQIAESLQNYINPLGVMVALEGEHMCMCSRGVKKIGSKTITYASTGCFEDDRGLRDEFQRAIGQ